MHADFTLSDRGDSIFYADLFVITGKVVFVTGHGKSCACAEVADEELARDMVCLTRSDNTLYGHFEMDARSAAVEDPIAKRRSIDAFVYMISEEDTPKYRSLGYQDATFISLEEYKRISLFNISFKNGEDGIVRFDELAKGLDLPALAVPFCSTVETKAKLLCEMLRSL